MPLLLPVHMFNQEQSLPTYGLRSTDYQDSVCPRTVIISVVLKQQQQHHLGDLLEMQILRPQSRSAESDTEGGTQQSVFQYVLSGSDA